MLEIERTNQFKKDFKLAKKRGKKLERIVAVVDAVANQQPLHPRHRPHKLTGELASYWECHVEPDCLLMYEYVGNRLVLVRLGTHSDLF
jgi:mRNA interferase YafQ